LIEQRANYTLDGHKAQRGVGGVLTKPRDAPADAQLTLVWREFARMIVAVDGGESTVLALA
jgi:hypothetical protein